MMNMILWNYINLSLEMTYNTTDVDTCSGIINPITKREEILVSGFWGR